MEVWRVRPPANAQKQLEMTVLLLELVYGFKVAIKIVAYVIPRIAWIMDVLVCPDVREDDLACILSNIGKGIKYMSE